MIQNCVCLGWARERGQLWWGGVGVLVVAGGWEMLWLSLHRLIHRTSVHHSLKHSLQNTVKPVCNDHLYNKIYYL